MDLSERTVLLLYSSVDEHEKALGLRGAQTEIECIWAYTLASDRTFSIYIYICAVRLMTGVFHNYTVRFPAILRRCIRCSQFCCAQRKAEFSATIYYCWRGESGIYGLSSERSFAKEIEVLRLVMRLAHQPKSLQEHKIINMLLLFSHSLHLKLCFSRTYTASFWIKTRKTEETDNLYPIAVLVFPSSHIVLCNVKEDNCFCYLCTNVCFTIDTPRPTGVS